MPYFRPRPKDIDFSEFDPEKNYSSHQLELFADGFLWDAYQKDGNKADILFESDLKHRIKREIYNASGIADSTLTNSLDTTRPGAKGGDGQKMFHRYSATTGHTASQRGWATSPEQKQKERERREKNRAKKESQQ